MTVSLTTLSWTVFSTPRSQKYYYNFNKKWRFPSLRFSIRALGMYIEYLAFCALHDKLFYYVLSIYWIYYVSIIFITDLGGLQSLLCKNDLYESWLAEFNLINQVNKIYKLCAFCYNDVVG